MEKECGTQHRILSRQDSAILPTLVANHCAGFSLSCLLACLLLCKINAGFVFVINMMAQFFSLNLQSVCCNIRLIDKSSFRTVSTFVSYSAHMFCTSCKAWFTLHARARVGIDVINYATKYRTKMKSNFVKKECKKNADVSIFVQIQVQISWKKFVTIPFFLCRFQQRLQRSTLLAWS